MASLKAYPTIAACGLDCGLCPRHYTVGTSRCPGCGGPGFHDKHPSCSFITCCVKKRGLEACGQCPEFPCSKFKSEEEYRRMESPSYPPARKMRANLAFIKEKGIEEFLRRQARRIALLEAMLADYDDGRSRSFFCRSAALLDVAALERALDEAGREVEAGAVGRGRVEAGVRAKVLRGLIDRAASRAGVDLTVRS
jgi:hypothetical protein